MSHPSNHDHPPHHDRRHTHPPEEHLDEWHMHTVEEGAPQQEHAGKANPVILFGAFVACCVSVLALVGLVVMYFGAYKTDLREKYVETLAMADRANASKAAALGDLHGPYALIGANQENVRIPIEQAIEKVVEDYARQPR